MSAPDRVSWPEWDEQLAKADAAIARLGEQVTSMIDSGLWPIEGGSTDDRDR